MLYHIKSVTSKAPDWKIVDGMGVDGVPLIQASVNRTNKRGEVFPRFDDIVEGARIEGEPWANDSGKQYLFPPRVAKAQSNPRKNFDVAAAQERKKEAIQESQENKEYSIRVASTFSNAVAITVALMREEKLSDWHTTFSDVRNWLWNHYDVENPEKPPF